MIPRRQFLKISSGTVACAHVARLVAPETILVPVCPDCQGSGHILTVDIRPRRRRRMLPCFRCQRTKKET